ncbi:MAG TPA: serine/threonine-protein kinase [Terracidiphilus sp.]|jgi:serine/threonine protein kinase
MRTLLTAQDWIRLQEIFGIAVELAESERSRYLDEACSHDPTLRLRIDSLLQSIEGDTSFQHTVARAAADTIHLSLPSAGDHLGPYEIAEVLGRGGMGVVYRAIRADDEYNKEVAIKVVAFGLLTSEFRQRFLRERQILANLDHPHIARLLDGGTTAEGMPFVVMEFVAGKPIDQYCAQQTFDREARIQLIIKVVRAVEYAHKHLVVHRDLKPDNILITEQGSPKLLDFGIAKALSPDTLINGTQTVDAARLMTPDYASPEQVRGETITTATDVYQLGVLSYLLLVGERPFSTSSASLAELEHIICESLPPAPNLDADLDRILLQALEKDPRQRYSSAESFAQDLERYLGGFPVQARSNSLSYRARKFIYRHKLGVSAASLLLVLIVGFSIGIALLARRLDRERTQAEVQLQRSERVSQLLEDVFGAADPNVAQGRSPSARELLDRGMEQVGRTLDKEPEVQASLYATLGHIYDNLGEIDRAESLMERSLAIWRRTFGENSIETAAGLTDVADLLVDKGDFVRAEAMCTEALHLRETLLGQSSPETAETLDFLGISQANLGKWADAEKSFSRAVAIWDRIPGSVNPKITMPLDGLGVVYMHKGDFASAETAARRMLDVSRSSLGEDSPDTAQALKMLGSVLQSSGKHVEAEELLRSALAVERKTLDPGNMSIGDTEFGLADELRDEGKWKEAEQYYRDSMKVETAALGATNRRVTRAQEALGLLYKEENEVGKAEQIFRSVLAVQMHNGELAGLLNTKIALADVLVTRNKLAEAKQLSDSATETAKKNDGGSGLDTANVLAVSGRWFQANGELDRAYKSYQQVLSIDRARLPAGNPLLADALESLGSLMLRERRSQEAEPLLAEALAIRLKTSPAGSPRLGASQKLFAQAQRSF